MTEAGITIPQGARRPAALPAVSKPGVDADDSFAACLGGWNTGAAIVAMAPPLPVPLPVPLPSPSPMPAGAGVPDSPAPQPASPAAPKPWNGKAQIAFAEQDAIVPAIPESLPAAGQMPVVMTVLKQERHLPPPFAASLAGSPAPAAGQEREGALHSLTLHLDLGKDRHIVVSMQCRDGVIDLHLQPDTPEMRALVLAQAGEIQQMLTRKGIPAGPIVIAGHSDCTAEPRAVYTPAAAVPESHMRSPQNQVPIPHGPQQDVLERRRGSRRHHF